MKDTPEVVSPVAARVIEKCGGHKKTAALAECTTSWVYRWTYPRSRSGTGGVVPHVEAEKLLKAAAKEGINLTAADFFESA